MSIGAGISQQGRYESSTTEARGSGIIADITNS
jgi:hypothetical protein